MSEPKFTHILVDGMNVIGSRPDGWWRDRSGARTALTKRLEVLARSGRYASVTVVFDGRPRPVEARVARRLEEGSASLTVRYAPGGPDAADHVIADLVEMHPQPTAAVVVTADGALAKRVSATGALVEGPRKLLDRLDGLDPIGPV